MKRIKFIDRVCKEDLIRDYVELKSCRRVAVKYNVCAYTIQMTLKAFGALRDPKTACKERPYKKRKKMTEEQRVNLSKAVKLQFEQGRVAAFKGRTHSDHSKQLIGAKSKERTGTRNPNYKTGKYKRRSRDYLIHDLTKLRVLVFERDSYTCQVCLVKGGNLNAHHLIPFWVENSAYTDLDNLLTTCTDCHFKEAHNSNWQSFNVDLIPISLSEKYSIDRERLSEMAANKPMR